MRLGRVSEDSGSYSFEKFVHCVCVLHAHVYPINLRHHTQPKGRHNAPTLPKISFPLPDPTHPHNQAAVLGGTVGSDGLQTEEKGVPVITWLN